MGITRTKTAVLATVLTVVAVSVALIVPGSTPVSEAIQAKATTLSPFSISNGSNGYRISHPLSPATVDCGLRFDKGQQSFEISSGTPACSSRNGQRIDLDHGTHTESYIFEGSHIAQEFVVPRQSATDVEIRASIKCDGTFRKIRSSWEWVNGNIAFRMGPLQATDDDGRRIDAEIKVTADALEIRIDASQLADAAYPITIASHGTEQEQRMGMVGLRMVEGQQGSFPLAQFLVNGQSVEAYEFSANLPETPESDWWKGCSPTSAGMMMGYYDRNGYNGDRYDNLIPGGVCELVSKNSPNGNVPETLLKKAIASAEHISDFYRAFNHSNNDVSSPRTSASFNCLADFMGTSQDSVGNPDGITLFFYYTSGNKTSTSIISSAGLSDLSGLYGVKEYVEYSSYSTTTTYNQYIKGYGGRTTGYTYDEYKAEIDAGRPVIIHVTGHSMLGVGYTDGTNQIRVMNTWGRSPYTMSWGGSYEGRQHLGVSVLHLADNSNVAPTLSNSTVTTNEDESYTFERNSFPGFNDLNGDDLQQVRIVSLPAQGSLRYNGNAITAGTTIDAGDLDRLTYTPPSQYSGTATFDWNGSDHSSYAASNATLTISVLPVNDPPTAQNDSYELENDGIAHTLNVLTNDSDSEGPVTVVGVSQCNRGTASFTSANVLFTPTSVGTAQLTYTIADSDGATTTATIQLSIITLNIAPTSSNAAFTTDEDTAYPFLINSFPFQDANEGDTLSGVHIVTVPTAGTLRDNGTLVEAGRIVTDPTFLVYAPTADTHGTDSFTFRVRDSHGSFSDVHTMTATINSVNDAPVAEANSVAQASPSTSVDLSASGSYDPDGGPNALTFLWEQVDTGTPTVTINDHTAMDATFIAATPGRYRFSLTVSDGADTDTDEVDITIGNPLQITAPAELEEGSSGTVSITLPTAFAHTVNVRLSVTSDSIQVPSNVEVPAGSTSVDCAIQATDDTDFNGGISVLILADSDDAHTSFAQTDVREDDIPIIVVTGNALPINDAAAPSVNDHTDFGTASIGSSSTRTFTVQNTGGGVLQVTNIHVYGSSFELIPVSLPMSVDEPQTFQVRYTPAETGDMVGRVEITSNDPDNTTYSFDVAGSAVEPTPAAASGGGGGGGCSVTSHGSSAWFLPILLAGLLIWARRRQTAPVRCKVPVRRKGAK